MDARRRQMMIRIISEMAKNKDYAKKLGLKDVSSFRPHNGK